MADAPRIETVAIVGGGFMGTGIAETVAVAGMPVVVRDVDEAAIERGHARLESSLDEAVSSGALDDAEAAAARGRIRLTTKLGEIRDADLVIEAVPEQLELKLEVMEGIDSVVSEQTIVASNTSAKPITELSHSVSNPTRLLGMHFFPPVPVVPLVEIIDGLDTSRETVAAARDFAERLGKQVIETKDRSGFIVNMLLVPYLVAAMRMYEEGFVSRDDIDTGMRLGCGHPMGPLTVCDLIGLDNLYSGCNSLYEEYKRNEYAPPPLLKRMVASGRLGRKSGVGFYDYH
jgi:3-hydroxybutyryl-CoA dehydrogenase